MPILTGLIANGSTNLERFSAAALLQANNKLVPAINPNATECSYLSESVASWLKSGARDTTRINLQQKTDVWIIWAQLLPVRCNFSDPNGVITRCPDGWENSEIEDVCKVWDFGTNSTTPSDFGDKFGYREGAIDTVILKETIDGEDFSVTVMVNYTNSIGFINNASFMLQISLLVLVIIGLSVLRFDAAMLVMNPLRRMLRIVLLYAENPLSTYTGKGESGISKESSTVSRSSKGAGDIEGDELGNYETEQLITAIAKITDLLRKCWGVAGAGIISSNLARTKYGNTVVFNPTVPGKLVYALFGFAGIGEFGKQLRALDQDILILINDVAKIVHDEVYRWGFGDSGQCNKNLGAAFLMVFRIGDFEQVKKKREMATNVIFSSEGQKSILRSRRKKNTRARKMSPVFAGSSADFKATTSTSGHSMGTIKLRSLPGISSFTDRALIGFLKSFAGIYRDKKLREWGKDFRLGLGVGAFSVDMIFGMDAGWAVEGAVGSEYKIDATYLSPHVNMASRMMSACKQYGVNILVSEAVEELMSATGRENMRHLDTVTVKGSSIQQRVYTYDARHKGVDFFLYERAAELADLDSDRFTASTWNTDQDLIAMRKHISIEFLGVFNAGRNQYLAGNWKEAIRLLKRSNDIMMRNSLEEGQVEDLHLSQVNGLLHLLDVDETNEEIRRMSREYGDGPSRRLVSFMEKAGGVAPDNWDGYRPLTSK